MRTTTIPAESEFLAAIDAGHEKKKKQETMRVIIWREKKRERSCFSGRKRINIATAQI